MRFSNVLAVIAALTVSISAMPSVADISSEANTEDDCPVFCSKNSDCFGDVIVPHFLHRLVCTSQCMVDGETREASIGCSTVGGLVAAVDYQAVGCQCLERRLEVEKTCGIRTDSASYL